MVPEWVYLLGFAVNSIGLLIVIAKLIYGSGTGLSDQFHAIEKTNSDRTDRLQADWAQKFEIHTSNVGNVAMNMSDRFHKLELAAMESRAIAAETYMRRDSYHKATDEFKRDVRDAHNDLKREMHAGFDELKDQIGAVSMSIEENRKSAAARGQ